MQFIARRDTNAHEASDSFARRLCSPVYKDTDLFFKWKDAFPVVCNKTIEEVNASAVDQISELL